MHNLCRVCIKKAEKCISLNTKIEDSSNLSFLGFLNKCTSLNAREDDSLPQGLCSICSTRLKTFYSFVKMAEKSDIILREAVENSVAPGRCYDDRGFYWEEIAVRNEKIEEDFKDFNKEDSLHCQPNKNSAGSSLYILDFVKEEPRLSESISIGDLKEDEINASGDFESNLNHPEKSIEEPYGRLESSAIEHSDFEVDVPVSLLNRRFPKKEDEADSQTKDDSLTPNVSRRTENTYKCIKCDITFDDKEEFRAHCRNHICGNKHECNICGKTFARYSYLHRHLGTHEETKKYKCSVCGKSFKQASTLWAHMKIHSDKKPFQCETCGMKFHFKTKYELHLRVHLNITHPCAQCGKVYKTKKCLLAHLEEHAGEKKNVTKVCDLCNKEFANSAALCKHRKRHTDRKSVKGEKCPICSKQCMTKKSLDAHMENHKDSAKKCDQCGKQFAHRQGLRRHMKWHTNPRPFKCKYCGKLLARKCTYTTHMGFCKRGGNLQTLNKTKTDCEICGKVFISEEHLKLHMEDHKGITQKCLQCDKEFESIFTLRRHIKLHSNRNLFKCENCGKSLSSKFNYTKHIEICKLPYKPQPLDKTAECEICRKKFTRKAALNVHMETHMGIVPKCNQCGKEFTHRFSLRRHMKCHDNPKSEKCDKCNKKFCSKEYLLLHMASHKEIAQKCDLCDKEYKNRLSLQNHIRWHANPRPFKCENCGKCISTRISYDRHMKICKPVGDSFVEPVPTEKPILHPKGNTDIVITIKE